MIRPIEEIESESSPSEHDPDDLLPARMINELVYCPRLFYLMHIEGQFADSIDTGRQWDRWLGTCRTLRHAVVHSQCG